MAKKKEPTPLQQRFAEHYIQCWNATEAAERAGYKCANRRVLSRVARKTLHSPYVRGYLAERLAGVAMAADEVLARLTDQAAFDLAEAEDALRGMEDPADVLKRAKELGCSWMIKSIKRTHSGLNVEFHDSQKALELLGRHQKLFVDRVEHSGGLDVTVSVDDARSQLMERVATLHAAGDDHGGDGGAG